VRTIGAGEVGREEDAMRVSEPAYRELVLGDGDRQWELHDGELVEKPGLAYAHNEIMFELGHLLRSQLGRERYRVRVNAGRVRRSARNYYIPDVFVLPIDLTLPYRELPSALEVYDAPLPLVVEVWSPSTGAYDVEEKLREYQRRGDLENWRIHPYERTLTAWVRQGDGSYAETVHRGGTIRPAALPGVVTDLDGVWET
jgi:Uma2 family endonuclease